MNTYTMTEDVTKTNGVYMGGVFEVYDDSVWYYGDGHWVEITAILDSVNARQQFINLLIEQP